MLGEAGTLALCAGAAVTFGSEVCVLRLNLGTRLVGGAPVLLVAVVVRRSLPPAGEGNISLLETSCRSILNVREL